MRKAILILLLGYTSLVTFRRIHLPRKMTKTGLKVQSNVVCENCRNLIINDLHVVSKSLNKKNICEYCLDIFIDKGWIHNDVGVNACKPCVENNKQLIDENKSKVKRNIK